MPYLECEKCGGYYKLKPGGSANDFEKWGVIIKEKLNIPL